MWSVDCLANPIVWSAEKKSHYFVNACLLKPPLSSMSSIDCLANSNLWSTPASSGLHKVVGPISDRSKFPSSPPSRGTMRSSSMATAILSIAAVVLLLAVQDSHGAKLCMDSSMPSISCSFFVLFLRAVCDYYASIMSNSVPEGGQRIPFLLRLQRHCLLQHDGRRRCPEAVCRNEHLRHAVRRPRQVHPLRGMVSCSLAGLNYHVHGRLCH